LTVVALALALVVGSGLLLPLLGSEFIPRLDEGSLVIEAAQLRQRCVMTTYDPDTHMVEVATE